MKPSFDLTLCPSQQYFLKPEVTMRIAPRKIVLLFSLIFVAVVAFPQKTVAPSPGVAPILEGPCSGSPLPPPVPCPPNPRVSS